MKTHLNVTHIIRFLIGFHGLSNVLDPLDGAADIRVLDNGRLVGDTGGGGVTCRGEEQGQTDWRHLWCDFTKV